MYDYCSFIYQYALMPNLPVSPYGMRVWLGYRHEDYLAKRDRFVQKLADIFIPATVQQMSPLGLCGYFPTVLPDTDFRLPDETALVIYPSPAVYQAAKSDTTAGRAYSALHGPYFNFRSTDNIPKSSSKFPSKWQQVVELGKPYALCGNMVDWHTGTTYAAVVEKPAKLSSEAFAETIRKTLSATVFSPSANNECILQVNETFALMWEHVNQFKAPASIIEEVLQALPQCNVIRSESRITYISSVFTTPDPGVDVVEGELMDVRVIKE